MNSVKSWRRTTLAAYVLSGMALAAASYTLATTQANVNAIAAQQQRLSDGEWNDYQAADAGTSARSAAGGAERLDPRPYPLAVNWATVAAQVMPSVVMVSVIEQAKGDGSDNRAWLLPGVQTNLATKLLNRYRAWRQGWAEADQAREWVTMGAGFIVGDGNTVLTAGHLLSGAGEVRIKPASGSWRAARVIGLDLSHDVAVLLVAGEPGQSIQIAPAMPHQGQAVATIGAPEGWGFSLSSGIVSRYGASSSMFRLADMMQLDVPIAGGSSGGVVFNAMGEAVGMVSFGKARFHQAMPIGRVLAVADALRRGRRYTNNIPALSS